MKLNCPLKHMIFSPLFYQMQTRWSQDELLLNRAIFAKLGYAVLDQGGAWNIHALFFAVVPPPPSLYHFIAGPMTSRSRAEEAAISSHSIQPVTQGHSLLWIGTLRQRLICLDLINGS